MEPKLASPAADWLPRRQWEIDDVEWERVEAEMQTPPFIKNVTRSDFRRLLRALFSEEPRDA